MPLLAIGVFFAVFKVLRELGKNDGKPLKQDHEAPDHEVPKCCSAICRRCAVQFEWFADLEGCLPRCSGLCTQCSARCAACSGFWLPLSLQCNGFWLHFITCLSKCLTGLSKCLQACLSPFEKLPGCQGIAGLPTLVVDGLKRGMLGWLAQSTDLPLMRLVTLLVVCVSPSNSSRSL